MKRGLLALGLALYAWAMMGMHLYLRSGEVLNPLHQFRRDTMGRAIIALGAASVIAALVLGFRSRGGRVAAGAAVVLAAGWIVCLAVIWPI